MLYDLKSYDIYIIYISIPIPKIRDPCQTDFLIARWGPQTKQRLS